MRHSVNFVASLSYLLFFSLLFSGTVAVAEPEPDKRFGDWLHECEPGDGKERVCALTHTAPTSDGKGTLLKLTIRKLGKKQTTVLVALTPLGIYLPTGVVGKVDSSPSSLLYCRPVLSRGARRLCHWIPSSCGD